MTFSDHRFRTASHLHVHGKPSGQEGPSTLAPISFDPECWGHGDIVSIPNGDILIFSNVMGLEALDPVLLPFSDTGE